VTFRKLSYSKKLSILVQLKYLKRMYQDTARTDIFKQQKLVIWHFIDKRSILLVSSPTDGLNSECQCPENVNTLYPKANRDSLDVTGFKRFVSCVRDFGEFLAILCSSDRLGFF